MVNRLAGLLDEPTVRQESPVNRLEGILEPEPPRMQLETPGERDVRTKNIMDFSHEFGVDLSVSRRHWRWLTGEPRSVGIPFPEPIEPKSPVDKPPEGEATLKGQLVGGTIEIAAALTDLPRTLLRNIGKGHDRLAKGLAEELPDTEGVKPIKGAERRKQLMNEVYAAATELSSRAQRGKDFLLRQHPEWQADPPESLKDIYKNPSKFAKGLVRAVPLLGAAGFSVAAGAPQVAGAIMFTSEKMAAKQSFISKGATEEQADDASDVYGVVATALEGLQVRQGLKLLGSARDIVLNRAVQKVAGKSLTKVVATTALLEALEEMGQGTAEDVIGLVMLHQPIEGGAAGFADRRAQEALFAIALSGATGVAGGVTGKVQRNLQEKPPTEIEISKFSEALEAKRTEIDDAIANNKPQKLPKIINEAATEALGEQAEKSPEAAKEAAPIPTTSQEEIEAGQVAQEEKQPFEMTREEFDAAKPIADKPNDVFFAKVNNKDVEVVQNPSSSDRRQMSKEVREAFPNMQKGEPATRSTQDIAGNKYIWKATEATHAEIEPLIVKQIGEDVDQNLQPSTHKRVVFKAVKEGKPVPRQILEEYKGEKWADDALAKLEALPTKQEAVVEEIIQEGFLDPKQVKWLRRFAESFRNVRQAEKTPGRILSVKERALLKKDWKAYSRSRGYTETEIKALEDHIKLREEGYAMGMTYDVIVPVEDSIAQSPAKPKIATEIEAAKAELANSLVKKAAEATTHQVSGMTESQLRAAEKRKAKEKAPRAKRVRAITKSRSQKLLREVEGQVKQTSAWTQFEHGQADPRGIPISQQVIKVDKKDLPDVEAHFGERGKKGSIAKLWSSIVTGPNAKASSWDQAAEERGIDVGSIDDYLERMVTDHKLRGDTRRNIPESVTYELNQSPDWQDVALAAKVEMLYSGEYSEADIADEIIRIKVESETDILDTIDEADYDPEIRTISQAAEIGEKELEAERAAIQSEAEAPEVGDFLDVLEEKPHERPGVEQGIFGQEVITPISGKQGEFLAKEDFLLAEPDIEGQQVFPKKPRSPKTEGFLGVPFDMPEPTALRAGAEKIYQDYINRFASIENAVKKAKALGYEVLPGEDPGLRARAYLGLGRKVEVMLDKQTFRTTKEGSIEKTGEGLRPILDSYENSTKAFEQNRKTREKDFDAFLKATREVEDLQRPSHEGAKRNIVTAEQARQAQAKLNLLQEEYGDKGIKIFREHANRLYEYQKRVLHLLVDAGNMSQQQYDQITKLNKHYIPFDRVLDDDVRGGVPISKGRFTKARAPITKIKGSERNIHDPIESIIKNTYKIVNAADRNAVAANLAKFGRVLPEDISPVRIKMVPIKIDPKEILTVSKEFRSQSKKILDEIKTIEGAGGENISGPAAKLEKDVRDALTHRGFSESEANSFVTQIKKGESGEVATKETIKQTIKETQRIIISETPVETTIFRPSQFAPKGKVIEYFVKGKRKYVELTGNLYDAMTGLDESTSSAIVRILSQPAHWLRVGATITPEFIARNPIRDQWTALMQTSFGFTPFVDPAGAIADVLGKTDVYHEWLASGGAHSGFVELSRPALQKAVKELRGNKSFASKFNIISHAQDLSQLMEMATRLGAFKAAKRAGKTSIEAGFESREASIDFARRGGKMASWNAMNAFFGAGIQGLDKTIRTVINHPFQTAMKGTIAITLPSFLLYLKNRTEDDYDEMEQWKKDLFWNFKIGDTWWRAPKPFLFGQVFGSIPERFLEYADTTEKGTDFLNLITGSLVEPKKDKDAMDGIARSLVDAVSPVSGDPLGVLIPTALKPIIENWGNESLFLERTVVPPSTERLLPSEQYGRYTSETTKQLGKWLDYSPAKIENLITGYFGGTGRYALQGTDMLVNGVKKATGRKVEPKRPKQLADFPLVKGFVHRPLTGSVTKSVNDFYESTEVILSGWNTVRKMQKDGRRTEARGLLTQNPEIKLHKAVTSSRAQMSELTKKADAIIKKEIPDDRKRAMLRVIDDKKLDIARKVNAKILKAQAED